MFTAEQTFDITIVIVDHSKLHASFLEKMLTKEGYRNVKFFNDPVIFLGQMEDLDPDLVILDLDMLQMDGFCVMEQLTPYLETRYLPVLILSDERGSDYRLRALQSGATDFIAKPYESPEVLLRIRRMIEMRILHMHVEDQNKILEYKVNERTKELRQSQLEVIQRLAQAAEFRDNDTGKHILRMSHYCAVFAGGLGMSHDRTDLILSASPLHDVGKIGIPDSILLKEGPLTEQEYQIMKSHTTIGAQILAGSTAPVMKLAQTIALTHHEKWDGTGYPNQLRGKEIPIEGQICGICDVFDALTSERPYKNAWTIDEAVETLIRGKRKHFDSYLVDQFLRILPKIREIKSKYAQLA
jgi:putative two-component system response regulator